MAKLRKVSRSPAYQLKRDAAAKDIKKARATKTLKWQKGAGTAHESASHRYSADDHKAFRGVKRGKKSARWTAESGPRKSSPAR